jgi:hypothetical protein
MKDIFHFHGQSYNVLADLYCIMCRATFTKSTNKFAMSWRKFTVLRRTFTISIDTFTISWDTYIISKSTLPYYGGHLPCPWELTPYPMIHVPCPQGDIYYDHILFTMSWGTLTMSSDTCHVCYHVPGSYSMFMDTVIMFWVIFHIKGVLYQVFLHPQ